MKTRSNIKYIIAICCIGVIGIGVSLAFYASEQSSEDVTLDVTKDNSIAGGLKVDSFAPDFVINDPIKGKIIKEDLIDKPLFIFFTTTWCTPCQIGAENLAKYDAEVEDDKFNVLIVFVDPNESDEQYIDWKNRYGREDWYIAESVRMAKDYNVKFLDTKYLIDEEGIIRYFSVTPLTYEDTKSILEPYIRGE